MEMTYPKTCEEAELAIRFLDERIALLQTARKALLREAAYPEIAKDQAEARK